MDFTPRVVDEEHARRFVQGLFYLVEIAAIDEGLVLFLGLA